MTENQLESNVIHPNSTTFESLLHQNFPFPRDLISHITMNPLSSDGLEKLLKSCKYFFAKNKIVVVNKSVHQNPDSVDQFYYENKEIYLNLENFVYWVTESLIFWNNTSINFSKVFYQCNLKALQNQNQVLSSSEIDLLLNVKNITWLSFKKIEIENVEEGFIPIEWILEKLPNILYFYYYSKNEIFTSEKFKNMASLKFNSKFRQFSIIIDNLSDDTDFTLLCEFIKKNTGRFDDAINDGPSHFTFTFNVANSEHCQTIIRSSFDLEFQTWDEEEKPILFF